MIYLSLNPRGLNAEARGMPEFQRRLKVTTLPNLMNFVGLILLTAKSKTEAFRASESEKASRIQVDYRTKLMLSLPLYEKNVTTVLRLP